MKPQVSVAGDRGKRDSVSVWLFALVSGVKGRAVWAVLVVCDG